MAGRESNGDAPKINITPSVGHQVTPQKRRPTSSNRRPSSREEEKLEQWEDRVLGDIFRISLNPEHKQDGHGHRLHYLAATQADLEEQNQATRLNTGVLDQAILEAASNLSSSTKPLDYLLGCWKRVSKQYKALRKSGDQDPKFSVAKEARRLCMSYCIFAITIPDMFG